MASCFSHPAIPLAIACWFPSLRRPSLLVVASLLSAAPDLDAVGYFAGVPYESWCGHRGCTHSIAFGAGVAALLAPWLARRTSGRQVAVFLFVWAAWASHGLVDMATNGGHGIALLWPFSTDRMFWPWQPIEVAPLGIRAFFSRWGREVLASEALWLWLPAIVVGGVGLAVTRGPSGPAQRNLGRDRPCAERRGLR